MLVVFSNLIQNAIAIRFCKTITLLNRYYTSLFNENPLSLNIVKLNKKGLKHFLTIFLHYHIL